MDSIKKMFLSGMVPAGNCGRIDGSGVVFDRKIVEGKMQNHGKSSLLILHS